MLDLDFVAELLELGSCLALEKLLDDEKTLVL